MSDPPDPDTAREAPRRVLRPGDDDYPALLRQLADPPTQLRVAGTLATPCVAIVGSRGCTAYGREVATRLAAELALRGVVVVSGMARGIDAAAHRGALSQGATIAVLPGGLRPVYPRGHHALATAIVARGALVCEHDDDTEVARWHFPKRNRIIAGMSLATVVVEAAERSGARITADLALDYDREVLVVPGPVTSPTSRGCHALLRQGAAPCTGVEDVLEALPETVRTTLAATPAKAQTKAPADPDAVLVLGLLNVIDEIDVAEICRKTRLALPRVLVAITRLEAGGCVRTLPGNRIVAC